MNYKSIIKSRAVRMGILRALSFIPDAPMLKLQYRVKFGRKLNLSNPQRYTEKVQWYKLNYRNPLLVSCVDKYDVREYVKGKGLESTLVKCYGVYDRVEDVDFSSLPASFAAKATIGGGGNCVALVHDRDKEDLIALRAKMQDWINIRTDVRGGGREWPYYSGKKNRIIIEELLKPQDGAPLTDYKFFCFDGKIACVYVIGNRTLGDHGKLAIVDEDFKRMKVQSLTQGVMETDPVKPENYAEMVSAVKTLAKDFPHVRVDMYDVDGHIYFGELTFYGASGYQKFDPDEFDFELGKLFDITRIKSHI